MCVAGDLLVGVNTIDTTKMDTKYTQTENENSSITQSVDILGLNPSIKSVPII